MQALTIWPSTSESCVIPQLDLEVVSFGSSVKWGERRKRLDFYNVHGYGSLRLSRNLKACRNGVCIAAKNYDLRCKLLYLGSTTTGTISGFSKLKKGSLGAAFAVSLALDEATLGGNSSECHGVDKETDRGNEFDGDDDDGADDVERVMNASSQRVESARPEQHRVEEGMDSGNEFQIENNCGDVDHGEKVKNVTSQRVDVVALARRLSSARTADDVEEVLKVERILPLQVFSTVIRVFGKEKKLESAMALFEWLKRKSEESGGLIQPNLYIYNSLLGALKECGKFDFVEDIMSDMVVRGVHPSVVTYNTLMGIYTEQGRESKALQIFKEMPSKGISPSPASFSIMLFAYRRLEDGFGSLAFFVETRNRYKEGEIGRDGDGEDWDLEFSKLESFTIRVCYHVMRRWLVMRENRSSEVLRLLREIDEAGLQHGRAEHERLVWACTREEHCVVAKELYTRIREVDNEISLSVCNHLIWLLGKAKKWWAALEIYEDMLDKGPKPNNMSYELIVSHFNILLSAARKKGIWRWGVRLLNKMEEKGLKPRSREWNSVLVACSKAAETSAAIEIFKRMVEQGEKPTIISYGALLSALEKGKLYEQAYQVWDHMVRVGFEPNLHAYTIMASIHAGQGKFDLLEDLIGEMVATGMNPTVITFNAIISSCGRNGHGGLAYEWFERMKAHGIAPNEITYEMLIEALARDGKPRVAYELHLRARTEGLELSAKAYDAVVQATEVYGATVDVAALGPRPPERKKKVELRKNLSEFCKLADVPRRSKPFIRKEIYTSKGE
ncbi:protein LOW PHOTOSYNTHETIC EFFICIENCY 1, chloroplastic-like [Salvia hispanica]|uniref:protein LOW PHOTOSYNTHETIC EFFICIENCY 1, chloroplastic-like n=1 Tax=Salvia hispanica TaxID=49212 RepID=UPI002009BDFB|nr:protein LOW PHOTOSYNTHETIC EFFICIENCY 1, chloroplastic-like [Salvia hispanica]